MPSLREKLDDIICKDYYAEAPKDYWRVSGLGMPYDQYHRRLGTAIDEIDNYDLARGMMIPMIGTKMHDMIQELTQRADVKILGMEQEVEDKDRNVKGHYDLYVEIDGKKILYDIKTINSKAYSYMKNEGGGIIKPYDHHVKQILCYDLLMGQAADEIRLFYISRDDGRREEIPVERSPELVKDILAEFDLLNDCWETKTPPPVPDQDSWAYKYSKYKSQMNV